MRYACLLILLLALSGCAFDPGAEKYLSKGEDNYGQQCRLAYAGNAEAIHAMQKETRDFNGASELQHAVNLAIVRNKNPLAFAQQSESLNAQDRILVQHAVRDGEKLLQRLHSQPAH